LYPQRIFSPQTRQFSHSYKITGKIGTLKLVDLMFRFLDRMKEVYLSVFYPQT
jgi:hypothetical protein